MAAQILAKGPLSSALGQYIFLGVGTLFLFTGDNGVSKAASQIANVAFRLVTGSDGIDLLREAALGNSAAKAFHAPQQQQQQPIVIHSHSPSSSRSDGGWTATIVQLTLASGACWTAYIIFTNYLPDSIKELMPVTRQFFESAVSSLGNGIIRVRDVLSEQIAQLGTKQDELSNKQDETHESVLGLKDDIGDVRLHIDDIAVAISRCEGSLTDAAGRQTYMTRGVQLLVQSVGDLLRPSNPAVAAELDRFSKMGELGLLDSIDDHYGYNDGRRGDKRHLECPSSPNLSEIGSTTSTSVDDNHHHNMRSLSLSRSRRSVVTPNNMAPNSSSKNMMSPPPLSLGMPSPPTSRGLRMLQSFNGFGSSSRNSNATTSTSASSSSSGRSYSRGYSSPEDEVPKSDHDPVQLEEVNELLRNIRSGRV